MIRPIDTQILHPQTPIIAAREQRSNHLPVEQQSQFGDIMKKEVAHKKDFESWIRPMSSSLAIEDQNKKKSKKKRSDENSKKEEDTKGSRTKIDIRI